MEIRNDAWITSMDPVEQACRTMEATLHEGGWDQPTRFMALSLIGDFKTADREELMKSRTPGGLLVQEIMLPEFVHADPAEGLATFLTLIGEDFAEEVEFLLHQQAGCRLGDVMRDAFG